MKGLLGMAGKKPDPYAYAVGGGGQKSDPYAYAIGGAPKSDPYSYAMGPATSKPDPYAYAVGGGSSAANKFGNKTSTSWTNPTTHNPPAKTGPPKDLVPERLAISYKTPTILLQYRDPNTDKLYHHKMPIKKLTRDTKTSDAMDYLKKKHGGYVKGIEAQQLEGLIEKLKGKLPSSKGGSITTTTTKAVMKVQKEEEPVEEQVDEEMDDDFDYQFDDEDDA